MNQRDKILLDIRCIELGIIPIDDSIKCDLATVANQIDEESMRKMKRKFRKIWRKIAEKNISAMRSMSNVAGARPTPSKIKLRKFAVKSMLMKEIKENLK